MLKKCSQCGEGKAEDKFPPDYRYGTRRAACYTCKVKSESKWLRNNSASRANSYLKYTYGITAEERDRMLIAQGGCCAICQTTTPMKNKNEKSGWVVDHCHQTGKIRAILCRACNVALGNMKESPSALLAAARYLEEHGDLSRKKTDLFYCAEAQVA